MRIVNIFVFAFFTSVCSQAQNTPLTSKEIADFKAKISQKISSQKTISGEFVQKKHLGFLANEIESSGKFYFSNDGKIKWVYLEPYRYSVIFKGGKMYIDNEGEKNKIDLSSNQLFDKLNKMIVGSINGKMLDNETFEAEYFKNSHHFIAHLTPTDPPISKLFEKIVLLFHNANYTIDQVKLVEPSGDYTQIDFRNLIFNSHFDASLFDH